MDHLNECFSQVCTSSIQSLAAWTGKKKGIFHVKQKSDVSTSVFFYENLNANLHASVSFINIYDIGKKNPSHKRMLSYNDGLV